MFNLLICACWEQTLCVLRFGKQCLSGTSPQLTANTTLAFPGKPPLTPHDNVAQQSPSVIDPLEGPSQQMFNPFPPQKLAPQCICAVKTFLATPLLVTSLETTELEPESE